MSAHEQASRFPYPENTVVVVTSDRAAADVAQRALEQAGVAGSRISVLSGSEGAELLDPDGEEHGRRGRLFRHLQRLGGEDRDVARYADRLRAGGQLIAVEVDNDGDARRAGAALRQSGAGDPRYYGRWTVSDL